MLSPELLSDLRPRGLKMSVVGIEVKPETEEVIGIKTVGSDRMWYRATVEGKIRNGEFKTHTFMFSLPIATEGVFVVGGLYRFVIPQGILDVETFELGKPAKYYFRNRLSVIYQALFGIFDSCLVEFYMAGNPPQDSELQNRIDSWFKSSPETRDVIPTRIGIDSIKEMVSLHIPNEGLDLTQREFPSTMLGILDPASTPAGERVNQTYRLTKGTDISTGVAVPSGEMFCSTITNHHLPVALAPRRTHLVRSAYEAAIALDTPEDPLIGNKGLKGRHLLTGIMNLKSFTGDDAIVISASASIKLRATRTIVETFYVVGSLHMHVKEGDSVLPRAVIAETTDPLTQVKELVTLKKIKGAAVIQKIDAVRSSHFNIPATRIRVTCQLISDAKSGDKVITRSAIKGVLRVIADNKMPTLPDGRILDAIISPESVINRRVMSLFWEAMAYGYVASLPEDQREGAVLVDHFDPRPTFVQLVEKGYGKPIQLTYEEKPLPEQTFVGMIYFLRLDKISNEIASSHSGDKAKNGMRVDVDNASLAGQRRDYAKAAALMARGMDSVLQTLTKDNMRGGFAYEELAKVIRGVPAIPSVPAEACEQTIAD
ncbi:MAG: hypothetical protein E6R03_10280 [Hyphomicrobiaceae bacterium]|nr:MAG: hypothetical protein E6R03_10280 [Hyphomicrobiaceae bacterium]